MRAFYRQVDRGYASVQAGCRRMVGGYLKRLQVAAVVRQVHIEHVLQRTRAQESAEC